MADEEESKRVSIQVSSLSTQLIESIDKQSKLEEQLHYAKKIIAGQKESLSLNDALEVELKKVKSELESAKTQVSEYKKTVDAEKAAREKAEDDVDRLNKEVEDLTASLFDEANKMVADARRETHSFEIKNSKLIEQLREKDNLLDTLSIQLKNLKKVLYNLDSENTNVTPTSRILGSTNDNATSSNLSLEKTNTTTTSVNDYSSTSPALFSPILQSLRYDLTLYNEFLKFIAVLPMCTSIKDTTSHSKLLKRLVHDEIQPVLRLDNASGLGWFVRRNVMSLMIEGLVVVEPLSGINETYRVGYSSPRLGGDSPAPQNEQDSDAHLYNYPVNSPPVAIQAPCAFCSESRNDILEHGRLYVLRTQQKNEDGSVETISEFPLCHYCLLKVRQTCEIFAFLRSLQSGAWNLEKLTLKTISQGSNGRFSEVSKLSSSERSKEEKKPNRMSFMAGLSKPLSSKPTFQLESPNFSNQNGRPTTNIQRAWVQLSKLRSSLHWAHIGVWSVDDAVALKIGPMSQETDSTADSNDSNSAWFQGMHDSSESFTLQKEADVDKDAFDFEKGDDTIETIQVSNKKRSTSEDEQNDQKHKTSDGRTDEEEQSLSETAAITNVNIISKSDENSQESMKVKQVDRVHDSTELGKTDTLPSPDGNRSFDLAVPIEKSTQNDQEPSMEMDDLPLKSEEVTEDPTTVDVSDSIQDVSIEATGPILDTLIHDTNEKDNIAGVNDGDVNLMEKDEEMVDAVLGNSIEDLKTQNNTDDEDNIFDDALSSVSNS